MDRFFNELNQATQIKEEDYIVAENYIRGIDALAKLAYGSVYVIDYYKREFLYVSPNPLFLCGLTPEEVKALGYDFYSRFVPEEDLKMLLRINEMGFIFFEKQCLEDRYKFSISYDFHLIDNGEKILINHKLTPLSFDSSGKMWLGVCYVTLSTHKDAGNVEIRKTGQPFYWEFDLDTGNLKKKENVQLSKYDKEVLLLSARGLADQKIAEILHRSPETIKSRKKKIFNKLGVKTIKEAILYAECYKLI